MKNISSLFVIIVIINNSFAKKDQDYGIRLPKDWHRLVSEKSPESGYGHFVVSPRAMVRCEGTDMPMLNIIDAKIKYTKDKLKYDIHVKFNITKDIKIEKAVIDNYIKRNGKLTRFRHMVSNTPCNELFMRLLKPHLNITDDCVLKKSENDFTFDDINQFAHSFLPSFYYIRTVMIDRYYTEGGIFLCLLQVIDLLPAIKNNLTETGFNSEVEVIGF